jgi:transposase
MQPVFLDDEEQVLAFRTRRPLWGVERTVVVLLSERLRQGQKRGILQHVASAQRWLVRLAQTLERGKQRRSRTRIRHDIEARLRGRQHLHEVLKVDLSEAEDRLAISYTFDHNALDTLDRDTLGRIVLITDRHDWTTAEIIRAYRGQAAVEAVRRVTVLRLSQHKGRSRVSTQLEEPPDELKSPMAALGLAE